MQSSVHRLQTFHLKRIATVAAQHPNRYHSKIVRNAQLHTRTSFQHTHCATNHVLLCFSLIVNYWSLQHLIRQLLIQSSTASKSFQEMEANRRHLPNSQLGIQMLLRHFIPISILLESRSLWLHMVCTSCSMCCSGYLLNFHMTINCHP